MSTNHHPSGPSGQDSEWQRRLALDEGRVLRNEIYGGDPGHLPHKWAWEPDADGHMGWSCKCGAFHV